MSETPNTPMTLEGRFPMVRDLANGWWVFVLRGAVAILFGILILMNPGIGLAFVLGILGAIAVFFGAWIIIQPGAGLLAIIWIVAFEALLMGGMLLAFGFRLRRIANDPHGPEAQAA
jgi:uncharacterized membrane protein HdeD (DUF308 family)